MNALLIIALLGVGTRPLPPPELGATVRKLRQIQKDEIERQEARIAKMKKEMLASRRTKRKRHVSHLHQDGYLSAGPIDTSNHRRYIASAEQRVRLIKDGGIPVKEFKWDSLKVGQVGRLGGWGYRVVDYVNEDIAISPVRMVRKADYHRSLGWRQELIHVILILDQPLDKEKGAVVASEEVQGMWEIVDHRGMVYVLERIDPNPIRKYLKWR